MKKAGSSVTGVRMPRSVTGTPPRQTEPWPELLDLYLQRLRIGRVPLEDIDGHWTDG